MTAKDLKNALLQEAVQGKLVPQIASEGNARDLLEEIRKEKLSHGLDLRLEASLAINAKSGKRKSKKETALVGLNPCDIKEDEIPFEIPENWCWCRIGEIFNLQAGKTISSSEISETSNGNDYLCYGGNGIRGYVKKYNKEGYYPLIGRQGALCGNINFANGKFYATEHAVVVETYANTNIDWAGLFLRALNLNQYATATAQPGLAVRNINEVFIPLPPLAEQKRIVAAIEKFMPLIEEYDKKETELKALNEQIGTLTKKAILQEAVQGKLVPQIAAEGNAKDLLEEIKKEKAKVAGKASSTSFASKTRAKEFPPITDDEIPFDIPESWCWCRLGELAEIITKGSSPSWQGINYVDKGILFVTSENVGDEELLLSKRKFLEQKFNEIQPRSILQKGDILTNIVGASIGRTAIFDLDIKNANINQAVALIRLKNKQLNSYIVKVLNSKTIIDQMTDNTVNTARANISLTTVENFKIPLPPLAEQKRIVAAIEKMLPLCEKLGV